MEFLQEHTAVYRYFYLNREKNIFSNISQLPFDSMEAYLEYIKANNLSSRTYDVTYLQRRFRTEQQMYDLFCQKGGKPRIRHPYYFTLGRCHEWFYGVKHCFGSLAFSLSEFDPSAVSFTYGDSVPTFMPEFADGKEYRSQVYTWEELPELIARMGMPNEWNTYEKSGPENYIEVQVWTDIFTSRLSSGTIQFSHIGVAELAARIIKANPRIGFDAISQKSLPDYTEACRTHPLWPWFSSLLRSTRPEQFKNDIVHGIAHAHKCALMAFILAAEAGLPLTDFKTMVYAALFHDVGRNFYREGKSHGAIGSEIIQDYLQCDDAVHLAALKEAIEKHDDKHVKTNNPFLIWLRDIDSLDYIRLGIGIYDTTHLKTDLAKSLVRLAIELNIHMYIDEHFIISMIGGSV